MTTPKHKPAQKPLDTPPASQDEQTQPNDDQQDQDEPEQPDEDTTAETEPSEDVRAFAQTVRDHQGRPYRTHFEPVRGVTLLYGYNGLIRVRGHQHVHVATLEDLATMSDQALYDAVMAVGARKKL